MLPYMYFFVLFLSFCYDSKCDQLKSKDLLVDSVKIEDDNDYSYFINGFGDFRLDNNDERNLTKIPYEGFKGQVQYTEEEKAKLDKLFGYTGPTANDEPENLERPCALEDWQCIRKFFASHAKCKPAYGPVPDPLYQDIVTVFFPSTNLTAVLPNLEIRGLSTAKVNSFYVNKKTGNLVFAFDLGNFNVLVRRAYLRYRRTAKESIILAGLGTINFRASTFTAVLPNYPDLRLDLADIHVDVQDGLPPFFLSPEIAASPDPDVLTAYPLLLARLPISIREALVFESQFIAAHFIQKNICDFGFKLISV